MIQYFKNLRGMVIIALVILSSCHKDKTAPTIKILSNVYNETQAMKGDTIVFQISAEDKAGVKELKLLEDGVLLHSSQSSSLSYDWFTAEVDSGRHHFTIIATDEEDNQSEDKLWVYVNEISFARVEGGTFIMGSNNGEDDEGPEHSVTLDGFEIMKTEVTVGQFACFLNAINCPLDGMVDGKRYFYDNILKAYFVAKTFPYKLHPGLENRPISTITWYGAQAFGQWLGGRLPSEAEWEFACRGGNQSQNYLYSGSNDANEVAILNSSNDYFVASKLPNELGIYDMSG
ncbi:SUMF1/EgtB/PvdO family nonheme iron enzyme [Lentimicrobium sp. L6]|uniref:formylglycine-generating enzyme family protein n=1 Tax=Lentimicrobium sp. L6 TaxID=2735916 RepID=UPI001556A664|nr:SUMF1/EgtB/PvdO family nonheme iron enzyme [Lentimicrobium sp. L6]NPD83138.1 SUMF1/EgtB/PvdO family nonheme iron enzyme [Lentimicrobium sp. L6]